MNLKKAVFLDRDGTVNIDLGYVSKPEDFILYKFTVRALSLLQECDFMFFIVTNQSGIARGLYTEENLKQIHLKMEKILAEKNIKFTDIFYSPYHPDGLIKPFDKFHSDRKPGLGLFYKAQKKYSFLVKKSFMIGDKYSDIAFGKKAGLKTILVLTGEGEREFYHNRKNWIYKPDFVVSNLLSAAKLICKLDRWEKR